MKWYKFIQHKAYFDRGYSFTSYIKYMIAFFGISSLDVNKTMMLGLVYALFCYFFGRYMYKSGVADSEAEVSNRVNPFVKEVREEIIYSGATGKNLNSCSVYKKHDK